MDFIALKRNISQWGQNLGFDQVAIADINLSTAEQRLSAWLKEKFHGDMNFMVKHGVKRTRPEALIPGTQSVICVRMDYLPETMEQCWDILNQGEKAYISRYALGRDYHKVLRKKLQQLADQIDAHVATLGYRVFCDSAPVMEKPLAEKAGLGWIGKHTNLINRHDGSWFFLGEIYTDLPLPPDAATTAHCGSCRACIDICPTQAIVAPYKLDARKCISYLTIEHKGAIPVEFRQAIGNRIYGCDDCQLVCPWNRYAKLAREADFAPKHQLDSVDLLELFAWDESQFNRRMEGSAIRRIGHERWQRNIAVALGNAPRSQKIIQILAAQANTSTALVREHIDWALKQQNSRL